MLKRLSEGNFASLVLDAPPYGTSRPHFYKTSKGKKQAFSLNGQLFVLSPEFKTSSLLAKATELCLLSTSREDFQWQLWYAAFPYFFEKHYDELEEPDGRRHTFVTLELHVMELQNVSEVIHVPFKSKLRPHFGDIVETSRMPIKCSWTPEQSGYPGGFPMKCRIQRVRQDVFFVFGGLVRDEVVNELTVIGIHRSENLSSEYAVKPEVKGILPTPRRGFAFCEFNSVVFLFGGSGSSGFLNDLWKLELLSVTYKLRYTEAVVRSSQVLTCSSVVPRSGAVLCGCGDSLYLFGGKGSSGFNCPVSVLSLSTLVWSEADFVGPRLTNDGEKIYSLGVKGQLILLFDSSHSFIWALDINLRRSSQTSTSVNLFSRADLPGEAYILGSDNILKLLVGSHYDCHDLPCPLPALSRLLGAIFDQELFTDSEVSFGADKRVRMLRSALAVRGSEGAGVLRFNYDSEKASTLVSHSVFRTAVRYLYTDHIAVPPLPVDSHKGTLLQTESDFLTELQECAELFHMVNLRNLCVVALTQDCVIQNSQINLYADYSHLSKITVEPQLSRFDSIESADSELLIPDYRMICLDGEVGMHKIILFVQSSMFRTVFTGGFERDQEEFSVDYEVRTVLLAKQFMYTETLKINPDALVDLLRLAAFLGIQSLFLQCQRQAAYELNYSNFMVTYDLALQLNATHLSAYCEDVYVQNNLGVIKQYKEFLEENLELKEHLAAINRPHSISKKLYHELPEAVQETVIRDFQAQYSSELTKPRLRPPAYSDPLPSFLHELQEIGTVNLHRPLQVDLKLSKHVSLEDEQWEQRNRFVLSASDSSESDCESNS